MADKQADNTSRGSFRTLYDWLTGTTSPHLPSNTPSAHAGEDLPVRIGRCAIERKLGEGGMGVVYAARDDRLERTIALKTLSSPAKPVEFASDVAQLEALLEFIATREKGVDWPVHPIFGRMSQANWLRWAYLHTDHHLRQFGA